jgi:hypothetical protein
MLNNIIVIELTQFTERNDKICVEQISEYLKKLGIPTNIKNLAQDLYDAKMGHMHAMKPFTYRKPWSKIFLTKDKLEIIGYENQDGKNFTKYFLDAMDSIKPLDPNDVSVYVNEQKYIPYFEDVEELESMTIDDVLDKISRCGMNSLTEYELNILKSNS